MNQKEVEDNMKRLIDLFYQHGCSVTAIQSFIQNNYYYLIQEGIDNSDNIYFIYNHKDLYGVIWVNGDEYEWSIFESGNFHRIIKNDEDDDYIINMILGFADADKVKKIVPEIGKMNLENKIRVLKKLNLNSSGYHFK